MTMRLIEHANGTITVFDTDARRTVAIARPIGSGGYLCKIRAGSWSDAKTNPAKREQARRMRGISATNLVHEPTRSAALRRLSAIAGVSSCSRAV